MFDPDAHMPKLNRSLVYVGACLIDKLLKGRKPRIGSKTLLIAYAHASKLVMYKDTDAVDAMKKRMRRAKRATRKVDRNKANRKAVMLSLLIKQMLPRS
jgi:hypothetical protein